MISESLRDSLLCARVGTTTGIYTYYDRHSTRRLLSLNKLNFFTDRIATEKDTNMFF